MGEGGFGASGAGHKSRIRYSQKPQGFEIWTVFRFRISNYCPCSLLCGFLALIRAKCPTWCCMAPTTIHQVKNLFAVEGVASASIAGLDAPER